MEQIKLRYELDLEPNYIWLSPTATQAAKRSIPYVQELGVFPCREKYYTEREWRTRIRTTNNRLEQQPAAVK